MSVTDVPCVPETINFPCEEAKILNLWKELNVFQTCLKQSNEKTRYTFFDGPPFATGLPHYGHITAGTIKDVVTRYAHQQGFHVERRFGWDCHGLPVEFEIDKAFNIKGPDDVIKMGIGNYNAECRKIVTRYVNEWEIVMGRIGRWIDFKNDYKTMYPWYMESLWWVFKQLFIKGLVYQGNKVMPYSTACNTPLSNFESGQNYKEVIDPAITVSFPLIDDYEGAALLVWTTTPWTLPSNLSVCVNANLIYARLKQISTEKVYILLEGRIETVFAKHSYEILKTFPGSELKNLTYEPIFMYYKQMETKGAFRVLVDDYVTADYGTGIVHQAPYFGEDDYRVCLNAGIITKDQEPICPIDTSGRLTKPITDFEGQYVKDADKNIIAALKQKKRLIIQSQIKHSYPFCWRSDTPLIYRSITSWFIRVEDIKNKLKKCNLSTYWVPEFVKEKRFGNWLHEARDWAISRNRYWGTPIPIWMSESGDEIICVGSITELEELTGKKITDLHREFIDELEIPSRIPGNPPLRRITEVFDCWFESGAMPYAQQHYPFKNRREFEECFPADFIAESIDQTRGWFYTLLVISTALFGLPPFKNLIVNGLVLASDGQKMSKRKKNYPDPVEVLNKYGADALRLYLINSPIVRAENLNFNESGVGGVIKNVFLPWYNAFRFLFQNILGYTQNNDTAFHYNKNALTNTTNIMDCWILSFTQSLLQYVHKEMKLYHLYNVLPPLSKYFDNLTNCYIRMNRKRMKGGEGKKECKMALTTLYNILFNIMKIMSPFAPFLTETMYQYFKKLSNLHEDSVHYLMLPQPNYSFINHSIEKAVARMQTVIELGRVIRDRKNLPIKYPLRQIVIVHQDTEYLQNIKTLEKYVLSELNVQNLITTNDKMKYGITLRAEPNYKILGTRLKQDFKKTSLAIKALSDSDIKEMQSRGHIKINNHVLDRTEIKILFESNLKFTDQFEMQTDNNVFVLLDISQSNKMQQEGIVRELISRIQKLRKRAHLIPSDEISVYCKIRGNLHDIIYDHKLYIQNYIKAPFKICENFENMTLIILEVIKDFKGNHILLAITNQWKIPEPTVPWLNIELLGLKSNFCNNATKAMLLLEVWPQKMTLNNFQTEVSKLFGRDSNFKIISRNGSVKSDEQLFILTGKTVFVCHEEPKVLPPINCNKPFCKILNFVKDEVEGTLILENPAGNINVSESDYEHLINKWIDNIRA